MILVLRRSVWLFLAFFFLLGVSKLSAQTPPVKIEYFGSERGFSIGDETVTLLCIARNRSDHALPERKVRLRCYAASGLDYTSGDTTPLLPSLAPNQAAVYRWRLRPSDSNATMVAAVLIEYLPGAEPVTNKRLVGSGAANADIAGQFPTNAAIAVIPRFLNSPVRSSSVVSGEKLLNAGETKNEAILRSDWITLQLTRAQDRQPFLTLFGRDGGRWVPVAVADSLLSVTAAEEGQRPWAETWSWQSTETRESNQNATLILEGFVGMRWRARIEWTVRPNSGMVEAVVTLTARRALRCTRIELPRLLSLPGGGEFLPRADGSVRTAPFAESTLPESSRMAAQKAGAITFGLSWPTDRPFPALKWNPLASEIDGLPMVLGVACEDDRPIALQQGESLQLHYRLFAIAPSTTVRDVLKFQMP